MARANAANTDSCNDFAQPSETKKDFVRPQADTVAATNRPWIKPASNFLLNIEPWLARFVPILIAIFLTTLGLSATVQALSDRDRILSTARREIDLNLLLLSTRVSHAAAAPQIDSLVAQFPILIPDQSLFQSRHVYLTDQNGHILAQRELTPSNVTDIGQLIGPDQAVTTFAEQAGVMNIMLTNGTRALVGARNISDRQIQLIVIAPLENILEGWWQSAVKQGLLLLSVALLLGIIAAAYFWQSSKAREAELVCDAIRSRIDTALNRGKCGLWDWDIARGQVYWSQSMFEILGLDPREESLSIGELKDIMHSGDVNLTNIALAIAEDSKKTIDHIFRMRNASGHWVWLRMRAEVVRNSSSNQHVVGIAMDISEEKNHRESSQIADIRLRDAIDTISEAFVLWDADNCLAMCNAKFRHLHQIPQDQPCLGLKYEEFMALGVAPTAQNPINFETKKSKSARTYEAQLNDGRWLQINERRTRDGGYVSVGTDITKLKDHEEQLTQSETRLLGTVTDLRRSRQTLEKQAQQLAELAERYLEQKAHAEAANTTKARFLANMSHELRTPLNAIIGFSEMMHHETFGPLGHDKYVDYTKSINSSGSYLLSVISDVLEMSRLESGDVSIERRSIELKPLFARLSQQFQQAAATKTINLSFSASHITKLYADATAIENALSPLIQNAVKFTPDGGSVMVMATVTGGTLSITVEDNGIGISQQSLKQLGKPFEQGDAQLKNGMKGSGLGLAIAKSFIELHGGSMEIDSKLRYGTKVKLTIPNCSLEPSVQSLANIDEDHVSPSSTTAAA